MRAVRQAYAAQRNASCWAPARLRVIQQRVCHFEARRVRGATIAERGGAERGGRGKPRHDGVRRGVECAARVCAALYRIDFRLGESDRGEAKGLVNKGSEQGDREAGIEGFLIGSHLSRLP